PPPNAPARLTTTLQPFPTLFRSEQARVERAGPVHVSHGKAQVIDAAAGYRMRHDWVPPSLNKARLALARQAGYRAPSPFYHQSPDRKSTRLNSSHRTSSYAVMCL